MSSCDKFIGMLFLARDVTHSAHLNTRSSRRHFDSLQRTSCCENFLHQTFSKKTQ